MKPYLNEDFLLNSKTAKILYHDYAASMPIIDYHNHLLPDQMATDHRFENVTQAWLYGDHYKWRAMRTQGIDEKYITGNGSDYEKFQQWAATVPYTLRNPLHHWTHLELQRYFDIKELLSPETAPAIYKQVNALLQQPDYSVRSLLSKMKVKTLCTTDDPLDNLEHHEKIAADGWDIKVLPAFRPDKAMAIEDAPAFLAYVKKLEAVSGMDITRFEDFHDALKSRHDFFDAMGCKVADHGLSYIYFVPHTEADVKAIFSKVMSGKSLEEQEVAIFKTAMLVLFAQWNHQRGWVQQYHLGALRNNNKRMLRQLGPDTGWDSIGDFSHAVALSNFLDHLDDKNTLTKTILYNLNPADNELMATMAGNFNDGSVAGKVQWGSAWWFLDQKDGMTRQINTLSNMGLLSRFVGMLTDSRSFLSFPRHEYFRRILCNIFGEEMENGELPGDIAWSGKIIQDICYHNAKNYFGF